MTDLTTLRALEKRLMEASGGSYEIDAAVADVFPWLEDSYKEANGLTVVRSIRPVSQTLDAAVALVERVLPGWRIVMFWTLGDVCQIRLVDVTGPEPEDPNDWPQFKASRMSPALALLLAAVRALIAEGSK
jgi:hypothetical protein